MTTRNEMQSEQKQMMANLKAASTKPKMVPFKKVNLVEDDILKFLKDMRVSLAQKLCEKNENAFIPIFIAAFLTLISIPVCTINGFPYLLALLIPLYWTLAISLHRKSNTNFANKALIGFDERVEIIKKALLRGTVGMSRRSVTSGNSDPYQIIGTFYNELIEEEMSAHISLSDKEMRALYEKLDMTGGLNDRHTRHLESVDSPENYGQGNNRQGTLQ